MDKNTTARPAPVVLSLADGDVWHATCGTLGGLDSTRRGAIDLLCDLWSRSGHGILFNGERDVIGPAPVVGMPATMHSGSDRYAAKVVAVSKTGRKVTIALDCRATETRTYYRDARGRYPGLTLGEAEDYRDPSF